VAALAARIGGHLQTGGLVVLTTHQDLDAGLPMRRLQLTAAETVA
jgi:ABC-type transport system involved in cytochrome c biogenesis ATPase subunit